MEIFKPTIEGLTTITGSLVVTGSTAVTGDLTVDGTVNATFDSSTSTAISGAFTSDSSSLAQRISDQEDFSSSLDATFATDADLNLVSSSVDSLNAATSSYALQADISGSFTSVSESLAGRITSNEGSVSALNSASSSYLLNTTDTLTGDLTVTGTITAQEFHTEFVSASILYDSGSTKFGNSSDDIHSFTGSVELLDSKLWMNTAGYYGADFYFWNDGNGSLRLYKSGSTTSAFSTNGSAARINTNSGTGAFSVGGYSTNQPVITAMGTNSGELLGSIFETSTADGELHLYNSTPNRIVQISSNGNSYLNGGNVGIGTTVPSAKLHVGAQAGSNGFLLLDDGTNNSLNFWSDTNNFNIGTYNSGQTQYKNLNLMGYDIILGAGGSYETLRLTLDQQALFQADVQITGSLYTTATTGSTSSNFQHTPGQLTISGDDADINLDITSGSSVANLSEIRFRVDGGTMGRMYMHKGSKHMYLGPENFPTASLYLRDGSGTVMTISGSSVGIGTTTPGEKLHIHGTDGQGLNITGGTNNRNMLYTNSNVDFRSTTVSGWAFGLRSYTNDGSTLMSYVGGAYGVGPLNTDFRYNFYGGTAYNDAAMYIPASKFVGIGTDNPTTSLHVYDGYGTAATIESTNTSNLQLKNTSVIHSIGNSGANFFINDSNNGYVFYINSSGHVGIGTTVPGAKLHVNGEAVIGTGTQAINADADLTLRNGVAFVGIDLKSARTEGNIGGLRYYGTASDSIPAAQFLVQTDGSYHFYNGSNGAEKRMLINSSGYVGIGTESPLDKLHVHGGIFVGNGNLFIEDGSNGALIYGLGGTIAKARTTGGVTEFLYGGDSLTLNPTLATAAFTVSGGTQMTIDGINNFVGIGTTTPSAVLHVADQASQVTLKLGRASGVATIKSDGTADGHMIIDSSNASHGVWLQNYTSGNVYLATGGGSVGIGTTGLSARLHVNGSTITTGNLGVGTTSTANKLTVVAGGTLTYSGNDIAFRNAYGQSAFYHDAGGYVYWYSDQAITFYPGSSRSVTFATSGNVGIGTTTPGSTLEVYGSGSTVLDIQGTSGQLFSVTDDLTGTLFAVSDISGIPILEVEADGTVTIDGTLTVGAGEVGVDVDPYAIGSVILAARYDGENVYASFGTLSANYLYPSDSMYAADTSITLSGTWRARGYESTSNVPTLYQRIY